MWSVVYQRGDSNRGVSGPGIHGKLQSLVCRRTVRQTTNVAEDGVTTSGYMVLSYAWQIRAVGYSPVGVLVMKSFHLMPRIRLCSV